ncbi:Ion transport domain [Dillenia turbinata]|uniref:Ion transport domain n=1 Tax=Dillenia turbinata TaxID=194707 RepID=A0AAN8Z6J8_9MAGN
MVLGKSKRYTTKVQDVQEFENNELGNEGTSRKVKFDVDGGEKLESSPDKSKKGLPGTNEHGRSLKAKVLGRVFSEDYETEKRKILDPRGKVNRLWNQIFIVACAASLFVDPLFLFLPITDITNACIEMAGTLKMVLTCVRSVIDAFYWTQIIVRFHTAYVAPSSRVFGRGELVIDHYKIVIRYLCKGFFIDLLAAIPLPQANQVLVWLIIPNVRGSVALNTRNVLLFVIGFQYFLRLYLVFPLSDEIVKATGVMTETAWVGAFYNLLLFMLAGHIFGASWYLLGIERVEACWKSICYANSTCLLEYFDCDTVGDPSREAWFTASNITSLCDPSNSNCNYQFGIYSNIVTNSIPTILFLNKLFYCFWWGLQQLSCLGQNLVTSTYIGENNFTIVIATVGLVLFALVIGNMQRYLQSTTVRLEQWRVKRTDTELWMNHRHLPPDLRSSIRKYDQYKWVATQGVDEESLLKALPTELRRDIKRHLCLDLVRRVPLFDQMDDRMLDAICERLKPALCSQGMFLVREGDPVNEMLFIIRGHLDSYTTDGGRSGFFNSCRIGPGDFCGDELLTWALDPRPSINLPSSTRTVRAIIEAEAFALSSEDLKFVASQFRRLHSKQLRHTFRFYSPQWRTWGACFIQAAWRRYKRRKEVEELKAKEGNSVISNVENGKGLAWYDIDVPPPGSGFAVYAARVTAGLRRNSGRGFGLDSGVLSLLPKPAEPDFSAI